MRLLMVRHGITDWNAQGRYQGQSNLPLNSEGRKQAEALARRLSQEGISAVYTSDLQRATQTAQAIAEKQAAPLVFEPRLREIHFGRWEGLTHDEIGRCDPVALAEWERDFPRATPTGGETLAQLTGRVEPVLKDIREKYMDKTILLVSHAGPMQVLLCLALGLPVEKFWQFQVAPASLSEIAFYPAGAILNLLNDIHYLEETA